MPNELAEQFMNELSLLTQKYGIAIDGCGCCGSPYVYDMATKETLVEAIYYDEEKQQYI